MVKLINKATDGLYKSTLNCLIYSVKINIDIFPSLNLFNFSISRSFYFPHGLRKPTAGRGQ